MEINEAGRTTQRNFKSFLSKKPLWAYWIAYTVLCGILFGIFYMVMFLIVQLWWIPIIVIIVLGMLLGTLAFPNESRSHKKERSNEKK